MKKVQTFVFSSSVSPSDVNEGKGWTRETLCSWLKAGGFSDEELIQSESGFRARQTPMTSFDMETFDFETEAHPKGVAAVVGECKTMEDDEIDLLEKEKGTGDETTSQAEVVDPPLEAQRLAKEMAEVVGVTATRDTPLEKLVERQFQPSAKVKSLSEDFAALLGVKNRRRTVKTQEKEEAPDEIEAVEGSTCFRGFTPEIKDLNLNKRQVTHIISTESIDRSNDIVDEAGWQLATYQRNPVVLADHQYSIFKIIGSGSARKSSEGLVSTTTFGTNMLGEAAWQLVRENLAKAWSVGFRTLKAMGVVSCFQKGCKKCAEVISREKKRLELSNDDIAWIRGIHFSKQELLEYSLVAVPMNQDAVMGVMSKGCEAHEVLPLFAVRTSEDVDVFMEMCRTKQTQGSSRPTPAPVAASLATTGSRLREERIDERIGDALARMRKADLDLRVACKAREVTKR